MIRSCLMLLALVFLLPVEAVAGSVPSAPIRLPDAAFMPAPNTTTKRMSAEEIHALLAIQEESRQKVAALTASFPDLRGLEREALQQQVFKIKTDAQLAFLRAHIQFAEAKKDPTGIQAAKGALESFSQAMSPSAVYNIDAASGWMPKWDAPILPRNYAGGDVNNVHVSAVLDGDINDTYINSLMWQNGPDPTPSWIWRITLDSEVLSDVATPDALAPGGYAFLDSGPITVRGGRHTLAHVADPDNLLIESNESDNTYEQQWIWSPLAAPKGVAFLRSVPPDPGLFPNPNGDGFRLVRDVNFSWVISEAPLSNTDDYDLYVYIDYSGSTSGFSVLRKSSINSNNETDFVVGHFQTTPVTLYAAAVRYIKGNGAAFAYDQIDATNRSASIGNFQTQLLAAYRSADVYEAHLNAGVTYHFILNDDTPNTDLGLNLYPANDPSNNGGFYSRFDATYLPGAAIGQAVGTTSDVIAGYTASVDGYYPVVVYRQTGDDAATPVTYSLVWNAGVVGVSSERVANRSLMFSGAIPNPVRNRTSFVFSLPKTASVRVSLYDLNGRLVRQIADEVREAGEQHIDWDGRAGDGSPISDGIYFARMEALGQVLSQRVIMIR